MSHIPPPDYDRLNLGLRRPPTCLRTAPRACPTRSGCRSLGWEGLSGCRSRCRRGTQKLGLRRDARPCRPWQWQAKAEDYVNDEKGKYQKIPCSTGPQWSHRCFWKLSSKAGQKEDFLQHFPRWQSWWHYHTEGAEHEMYPCDMCVVKSYQEWSRQLAWLGDFRFYRTLAKSFFTNDLSRAVYSTKLPAGYASVFFSSYGYK